MKFKRRLQPDDEAVPMASMADIAFILVIFFMLTSLLSIDRGLLIELPETESGQALESREVVLEIDRHGAVSVDGRALPLERIGPYVIEARRANPRRPVVVRSDRRVAYGRVTDVMDELLKAGVRDVALPTAAEEVAPGE